MKTFATRLLLVALGSAVLPDAPADPGSDLTAPIVRLTILADNSVASANGVKAVWGFSCLVEARGHTVLFDTGSDPAVLRDNLTALKVDASRIEAIAISHFHGDHTLGAPGLGPLPGRSLYLPHSFAKYLKVTAALAATGCTLVEVSRATSLFDSIVVHEPLRFRVGSDESDTREQCLAVDTPEGLVVVVGCSHPGIESMLSHLRQQTGRPLHFVVGGFHLLDKSETEIRQIARQLKSMGVAHVSPTHCTGDRASHIFHEVFGPRHMIPAGVGAVIRLPLSGKGRDTSE